MLQTTKKLGSTMHTEFPLQDFERLLHVLPLPFPTGKTCMFLTVQVVPVQLKFSYTKAHDTAEKSLSVL